MIAGLLRDAAELGVPRRGVLLVLGFQLAGVAVELAGVFSLLPVIQYIMSDGDVAALVDEHRHWQLLNDVFGALGLPLGLAGLLVLSFQLVVLRQLFVFCRLRYEAWLRETAIGRVRASMFSHFLYCRLDRQESDATGAVVNDMTIELQRAAGHVFSRITVIGYGLTLIVYASGLVMISPVMTAVALALFGFTGFLLRGQMRKSGETGQAVTDANASMSSHLVERLKQARLVRLAGLESAEVEAMSRLIERQRSAMVRLFWLLANIEVIIEPIVVAAGFAFLYISVSVLGYPVDGVGIFLIVTVRLMPVVKQTARTRQSATGFAPSFRSVVGRIEFLRDGREHEGGSRRLANGPPAIAFDGVTFRYATQSVAAVSDLTLSVGAATMTAIVGPSGAGKSTLFDLLPRLREPDLGEIRVDGVPLREIQLTSLRRAIAYVPQSPQILNLSAAEHIRLGDPNATHDDVRTAARQANADQFIDALPEGYATPLGEGGSRLSGGQRQRIDLARALIRRAPILILDEPSASLDAESEAGFQQAIANLRADGRTTILIIAHRLATVSMADQIIVLQQGRAAAAGRHEDLLRQGGWYAEAFRSQHRRATPALAG